MSLFKITAEEQSTDPGYKLKKGLRCRFIGKTWQNECTKRIQM